MNRVFRVLNWIGLILLPILAVHFAFNLYSGEPAEAGVWLWAFAGLLFSFIDVIIIITSNDN
jgi:hypothetical protein